MHDLYVASRPSIFDIVVPASPVQTSAVGGAVAHKSEPLLDKMVLKSDCRSLSKDSPLSPVRMLKLSAVGAAALAVGLAKPTLACPPQCYRSETLDALYITVAGGAAGVICAPTIIAEVACVGGTVAAVTGAIARIKQNCAKINCGPFYSP